MYLEVVIAVVENIITPRRGPSYAVAKAKGIDGSITITFTGPVWFGKLPRIGEEIRLTKLMKRKLGWRAMSGRLSRPSDKTKQSTKSTKEKGVNTSKQAQKEMMRSFERMRLSANSEIRTL